VDAQSGVHGIADGTVALVIVGIVSPVTVFVTAAVANVHADIRANAATPHA